MDKRRLRKQFTEAKLTLQTVMRERLAEIGEQMVDQIVSRLRRLTPAQRLSAINELSRAGQKEYRELVLTSLAIIASDALSGVRKEVPRAAKVRLMEEADEEALKLGEFDKLPAGIRAKIKKQQQLLVDTQLNDLEKAIVFQFNHSVDSTDSLDLIAADLYEAAEDYVTGAAISGGAAAMSAQVINEVRNEFFDDPDVQEEIEAFEFVNGDPVSEICQDLAGTIFAVDDPNRFRYTPPLHFNCKSYIVPILKGNLGSKEIEPLKPSSKRIEDTIQFAETVCCGHAHAVAEIDSSPVN